MRTDNGVLSLVWGSGSLPGGSGLSEGTRRVSGVSQKRLRRVLQVDETAARGSEARKNLAVRGAEGPQGARWERPDDQGLVEDLRCLY